jgi:hypothetical protein
MMEFAMHKEKPAVNCLPMHLEDKQTVHYDDDDNLEELLDNEDIKRTPLTEWFTINAAFPSAKDVTYHNFPKKFVWEKKSKEAEAT